VSAPDSTPPALPAPKEVHVLVVNDSHMARCALEARPSPLWVTDYLVCGALVVQQGFLEQFVSLPEDQALLEAQLQAPAAHPTVAKLVFRFNSAYFQTGEGVDDAWWWWCVRACVLVLCCVRCLKGVWRRGGGVPSAT
jgi:hypothetical protein